MEKIKLETNILRAILRFSRNETRSFYDEKSITSFKRFKVLPRIEQVQEIRDQIDKIEEKGYYCADFVAKKKNETEIRPFVSIDCRVEIAITAIVQVVYEYIVYNQQNIKRYKELSNEPFYEIVSEKIYYSNVAEKQSSLHGNYDDYYKTCILGNVYTDNTIVGMSVKWQTKWQQYNDLPIMTAKTNKFKNVIVSDLSGYYNSIDPKKLMILLISYLKQCNKLKYKNIIKAVLNCKIDKNNYISGSAPYITNSYLNGIPQGLVFSNIFPTFITYELENYLNRIDNNDIKCYIYVDDIKLFYNNETREEAINILSDFFKHYYYSGKDPINEEKTSEKMTMDEFVGISEVLEHQTSHVFKYYDTHIGMTQSFNSRWNNEIDKKIEKLINHNKSNKFQFLETTIRHLKIMKKVIDEDTIISYFYEIKEDHNNLLKEKNYEYLLLILFKLLPEQQKEQLLLMKESILDSAKETSATHNTIKKIFEMVEVTGSIKTINSIYNYEYSLFNHWLELKNSEILMNKNGKLDIDTIVKKLFFEIASPSNEKEIFKIGNNKIDKLLSEIYDNGNINDEVSGIKDYRTSIYMSIIIKYATVKKMDNTLLNYIVTNYIDVVVSKKENVLLNYVIEYMYNVEYDVAYDKASIYINNILKKEEHRMVICVLHHYIKNLWSNGSKELYFYTLHNEKHSVELIKVLWDLIGVHDQYFNDVTNQDFYKLIFAIYCHDFSMVIFDNEKISKEHIKEYNDESPKKKLGFDEKVEYLKDILLHNGKYYHYKEYENNAKKYNQKVENLVRKNHSKDYTDTKFLSTFNEEFVSEVKTISKSHGAGANNKIEKLLCFLDACDIKESRVSTVLYEALVDNADCFPEESLYNWNHHLLVREFYINYEKDKLIITMILNSDSPFASEDNIEMLFINEKLDKKILYYCYQEKIFALLLTQHEWLIKNSLEITETVILEIGFYSERSDKFKIIPTLEAHFDKTRAKTLNSKFEDVFSKRKL